MVTRLNILVKVKNNLNTRASQRDPSDLTEVHVWAGVRRLKQRVRFPARCLREGETGN